MANRYIGLNYGQVHTDIVEGAATVSKDVEIKFNDNGTATKADVYKLTGELLNFLLSKSQYPAL